MTIFELMWLLYSSAWEIASQDPAAWLFTLMAMQVGLYGALVWLHERFIGPLPARFGWQRAMFRNGDHIERWPLS